MNNVFERLKLATILSIFLLFGQAAVGQTHASNLQSEFLLELLLDVDPQLDAGHT